MIGAEVPEQKYSGGVIENPPSPAADAAPPDIPATSEKGRRFVFTYFPKGDEDLWDPADMSYMFYGLEKCPTTNRLHHQGWYITHNSRSERAMCKRLGCWTRIMRGNYTHNWKYCEKDGQIVEKGTRPKQGQRSDLNQLKDQIVNKQKTPEDVAMETPILYHQYGRTLNTIHDIVLRKTWRTEKTRCIWYKSGTGCGKSHKAFTDYHPDTHYVWSDDKGWWDNYRQQDTVIIDDFRGQIPYNMLLRLADKWPMEVPRRNRPPMPFTSKLIIITSSMTPEEVYHNLHAEDKLTQLERRIEVKTKWKEYRE